MPKRAASGRTIALEEAIAAAGDEGSATLGLPDKVELGQVAFTFMFDTGDGFSAQDITFDWEGVAWLTWSQDISEHEGGLSAGSSSPVHGWASWSNGSDLLLAYTWPEVSIDGWAHVPGGAPGEEGEHPEDALYEPQAWVKLARTIVGVLHEGETSEWTGRTYR
uniref:Uncharacterized protein n=1 Tax=Rhodococcus sp. NS1 TaxID=402236 RepID=Q06GB2_9NOCA|nr:hypothetical protein [Rhodococcus sp. NS1]ABI79399.1 hypothetical protein PNSL1.071 [Rhodococcus sp. NS1]